MNRRQFLQNSLFGGDSAATLTATGRVFAASAGGAPPATSRVSLTSGEDHADIVFQPLKVFSREIARSIGNRRVVIRPNNVAIDVPLCATPAESLAVFPMFISPSGGE